MPKKKEIPIEERIAIVQTYLRNEIGINEAGRKCGVNKTTVMDWIRNYETDGIEAFIGGKNRAYTSGEKERVIKDYLNGEGSLRAICKKYRIKEKYTLQSWIKVYNGGGG